MARRTNQTRPLEALGFPFIEITDASYTVTLDDAGIVLVMNSASAQTVTINAERLAKMTDYAVFMVLQMGAGQVTIAGSGVTVNNRQTHTKTAGQYAMVSVVRTGSAAVVLTGDTAA